MLINTQDLQPHPLNEWIYGDRADEALIESIAEKGILTPLLVTRDNFIISGHRRWDAANELGIEQIECSVFGSDDETDILEALIEANQQRAVKHSQKGRAYIALLDSMESRQGERSDLTSPQKSGEVEAPTERASKRVGLSPNTTKALKDILECAEVLEWQMQQERAEKLIQYLDDNNPSKAHKFCKEKGLLDLRNQVHAEMREAQHMTSVLQNMVEGEHYERYMAGDKPTAQIIVKLDQYNVLSNDQKRAVLSYRIDNATGMNKQDNNSIEWAQWSWNPVTGCKHECPYCYARDIAERFYQQKFAPAIIPTRLDAPYNIKVPKEAKHDTSYKNVFVCSMADLFGRWVPSEWIQAVLDVCEDNPQWNFLFLTKFPIRMSEFDFPDNCWVGTTVDHQARVANAEKAFKKVNAKVKWLSIEPMLTPLKFNDLSMFSWVVLGGSSASTSTPEWKPPFEWIADFTQHAWESGCKVYFKDNLLERVKQFPYSADDTELRTLPKELAYLPDVE